MYIVSNFIFVKIVHSTKDLYTSLILQSLATFQLVQRIITNNKDFIMYIFFITYNYV